ncbi:T9SS type A sorting domain-containing protein [Psychroflexus tropicus]|uniref:T9SS type A sorting domain-containing protein n=1 Tax=Psychroflexus tropicus TaxID=197345 RepID=UPI0003714634|nr:T9SS type A sorting domain-containing protein [Psychroflexus tropicus]
MDINNPNTSVVNTVRLYTSSEKFPNGQLTELASKEFEVIRNSGPSLYEVVFDESVIVDASTELIVALDIKASPEPPNNYVFEIGRNSHGQTDFGYISSDFCEIFSPSSFESFGFDDNHIILNLIGDSFLDTEESDLSDIVIFPNPASEIIYLRLPFNTDFKKIALFNADGKEVKIKVINNSIDISKLSAGLYFLNLSTSNNSVTRKIIIE